MTPAVDAFWQVMALVDLIYNILIHNGLRKVSTFFNFFYFAGLKS
jgi:hypothetical protein